MSAVPMGQTLHSVDEVAALIESGAVLLLAGAGALLDRLPRGAWIGGTTPYFMSAERGGCQTEDMILVTRLPETASAWHQSLVAADVLARFPETGPTNGFTVVILPGTSDIVGRYAVESHGWPLLYRRPIIGWSAGVSLDRIGLDRPKVYDGASGTSSTEDAVVLHVALPDTHYAEMDFINAFEPGDGPALTFDEAGFGSSGMRVDGTPMSLRDYVTAHDIDVRLPLIADYNGAYVNVAVAPHGEGDGMQLFAPVFPGIEYRFARPVADFEDRFARMSYATGITPAYACNCINNYTYGSLEGKQTGAVTGPVAFGEIAYILLNQSMVYLNIRSADEAA